MSGDIHAVLATAFFLSTGQTSKSSTAWPAEADPNRV